jgi:hypothetical protein
MKVLKMDKKKEEKNWIKMNTVAWVITLVVSFLVFVPAFVTLLILWAIGRIQVKD